ncbi:glycoside hydrolase family 2 protein, partial [Parabacteroides sp. Marseille-P3160]|uniref:glycoside hydrolase family 2 protein n=1 Tax=Parabacteroides sp. Marseille-P3160 TaxID=1917887 RepID=UPI0009BC453E
MKLKNTLLLFAYLCAIAAIALPAGAQNVVQQEIKENWTFKQVRGNNWYPATVPSVVHTDLIANKIIEDPFFRLNERGVQWVDKEDWDYKTTLDVAPEVFNKENIELYFKGLDTYADVYLNDSLLLRADNMFREWRINVKKLLKKEGNELRIRFLSPFPIDIPKFDALPYAHEAGNDQSENGGVFNKKVSVFARKAGYHYGWDWGPRLVTAGIWRPAYLVGWNNARIESVQYIQESVTAQRAQVKVIAEVLADKAGEATLDLKADGVKETWKQTVPVKKGTNFIETNLTIRNPRLWWSNGLGEAHLYPFTATVTMNGQSDSRMERIGLRDLKVIREKDAAGTSFYFRLNGVNVFAKGANYIPQDNFIPRVTPEKYEKTIFDAVNANMNMLRVWGGGFYENDLFYDLCDQYGILVWQDFMFGCSLYPAEGALLENIRQEAIENVKRLRNHPSIALWCGNNENQAAWFGWGWKGKYEAMGQGIADKLWKQFSDQYFVVLPEVVKTYDPTRFYWPSSPFNGNQNEKPETGTPNWNPNGDAHYWGVWHGKDSIANYNVVRSRFFSEYGFQSFPEYQSILKYAPEERDHNIFSEVMMAHQRGGSHANGLIEWYLLNEYRKPKDFQNFLYMGQLLQGDAIKTAMEAHRRDMPYCMGSLFWQ